MSTTRHPTAARGTGDLGATIILAAATMVTIVVIAAIVVDLGHERAMRRTSQSVADMAALAGAQSLAAPQGADPVAACESAMRYIRLNVENLPATASLPCTTLAGGSSSLPPCSESTDRITVDDGGTAAPYQISFTWPVPNEDIADDLVNDANGLRRFDGHRAGDHCDRVAVDIGIEHTRFFSGIVGREDLSSGARAVARRLPYAAMRAPNLWLLEPHACDVLTVTGGGDLVVGDPAVSGLITTDSDASSGVCNNDNKKVLTTGGNGSINAIPNPTNYPDTNDPPLDPPGEISMVAVEPGQDGCVSDWALGNVHACNPAHAIFPAPQHRPFRATRAPVDWFYNCKAGYPSYPVGPVAHSGTDSPIPVMDCPFAGERRNYMDLLFEYVGSSATAGPTTGWSTWGNGGNCQLNSGTQVVLETGNWIVNCRLRVQSGALFVVEGGNVIFNDSVSVAGQMVLNAQATGIGPTLSVGESTASPTLPASDCETGNGFLKNCFRHASKEAAWIFHRAGHFTTGSQGQLYINNAALIQDHRGGPNVLDTSAQGRVTWTPPQIGPFRSLSLWSESVPKSNKYEIGGGGGLDLQGVFFTPEAMPFTLNGSGALTPQAAQFISRTLVITGGGELHLTPLGIPLIEIPPPASVLIR